MKRRREAQSSSLSFMDCICCGFGAVLLLFILTAKNQITFSEEDARNAAEAASALQIAIEEAEAKQKALDRDISALDPQPDTKATSVSELAAKQERLAKEIESQAAALAAMESEAEPTENPAGLDRPSADQSYLSGLRLRGPRAVILIENSGSMLASNANDALDILNNGTWQQSAKWNRAKTALKAVLAAIPKGTQVAILQMNETASPITGSPSNPFIDPYDNGALIATLERIEKLEAGGGANLEAGLRAVQQLGQRASSLLILSDGLPSSPAPSSGGVSEAYRVQLFNRVLATRVNYPVNAILFPFDNDPSAAGLYWNLSTRTGGVTLIPDEDWPSI
ncbi:MAG: vWA domain-containing protein [Verrucomicrobiota bacterium]